MQRGRSSDPSGAAVFNLGYAKILNFSKWKTQEPLEMSTSSDPRTHEDLSPKLGVCMPEQSQSSH
jgi:hypothetical protein